MAELLRPPQQELVTPPRAGTILLPGIPQEVSSPDAQNYTPEHKARIVFESFRHSQGDKILQDNLLFGVASLSPNCQTSDEELDEIINIAHPKISGFAHGVNHPPVNTAKPIPPELVAEAATTLQQYFNREIDIEPEYLDIAELILRRDAKFLSTENGRSRRTQGTSTKSDPWFSFICHYGFGENTTGISEFDKIYKEVASYFRKKVTFFPPETDANLGIVLEKYNQHHPESRIEWGTYSTQGK